MEAGPIESRYDVTQEVRIASVMFGGVSLAVYMNGITQELLRAVRATAPRLDPAAVHSTFSERAGARQTAALFCKSADPPSATLELNIWRVE